MRIYISKISCCAKCPSLDVYTDGSGHYCNHDENEMPLVNVRHIDENCPLPELQELDYIQQDN